MAVKSIKFKLKIGGNQYAHIRRGLYKTHAVFNEGVRYYQEWLLLMRQDDVMTYQDGTPEVVMSASYCKKELLRRLREVQMANVGAFSHTDEELSETMRALYELIVPSSVGKKGDAASLSRKFLSPLAWKDSKGLTGEAKAGNKPRWKRLKEQGLPYEEARQKWLAEKEADPAKHVPEQLLAMGLKPFLKVFTESTSGIEWFPLAKDQGVRTWDRDMFQQAIEGLMSWESWNRRVKEEYQKLDQAIADFEATYLADRPAWHETLRQVEQEMRSDSKGLEAKDEFAHAITSRTIRGWSDVVEEWRKVAEGSPEAAYIEAVHRVQSKTRGFGSEPLFKKLASDSVRSVLLADPNALKMFAKYNELLEKRANAKQFAQKTLPDPVRHPVWVRYDKKGGNLHSYQILPSAEADNEHRIVLSSLLLPTDDGTFAETASVVIPLAPSLQFPTEIVNREQEGICPSGLVTVSASDENAQEAAIMYRDRGYNALVPVAFGGAKIQFNRQKLKAGAEKGVLGAGGIGSAYINVTIDVDVPADGEVEKVFSFPREGDLVSLKPKELLNYMNSKSTRGCGVRVMSVDLGVRYGAAISVFEVKNRVHLTDADVRRLHYPITDCEGLVAVHERSVVLKLPGEGQRAAKQQDEIRQSIFFIRSEIAFLRKLLRVSQATAEHRLEELDKLLTDQRGHGVTQMAERYPNGQFLQQFAYEAREVCAELSAQAALQHEAWESVVRQGHRRLERIVEGHVKVFRNMRKVTGQPRRTPGKAGGLSIARIGNLIEERKLLVRWTTHPRAYGDMRRLPKDQTFAIALQTHIDHVKEDRIKKLADLLVMAARGYRFVDEESQWVKTNYAPCDLILFEDLSRYRFKMDRPPFENSQLMNWSHRELLNTVKMQASMFGIGVGTIPAAYTSRYDAETGAPGVRCKRVTAKDKRDQPFWLKRFVDTEKVDIDKLPDGLLIPVDGGEWFVSPNGYTAASGIKCVQADINAAHNLQRRFWSATAFRVTCKRYVTAEGFMAVPEYKSFEKQYGKGAFVSTDGQTYVYQVGAKLGKRRVEAEIQSASFEDDLDVLEEIPVGEKGSGERIQLFRDLSGRIAGGRWLEAKGFWGRTRRLVTSAILAPLSRSAESREETSR